MLLQLPQTFVQRQTRKSAAARRVSADAPIAPWPKRPDANVLSGSIPLFYISRDCDGLWIACEADFRAGGVFLTQRSAIRFAQRCSEPNRSATMILENPHNLEIENHGNQFADHLRPSIRFIKAVGAKIRSISSRFSRAYIEHRLLHAALDIELYRGRYRHSNKNDDDLPIVTDIPMLKRLRQQTSSNAESVWRVVVAIAIFGVLIAAIIGLRTLIWLPAFQR